MKRNIYLNEFNVKMQDASYLPLVSGLLRSYAETHPAICNNYKFMPFIYAMDVPEKILLQYTEEPDIACFSSVMWNEQLNYYVAQEVKLRWPNCLVIFGGPNVPMPPQHDIYKWMENHPFVDLAVRAEGEEPVVEILKANLGNSDISDLNLSNFNRFSNIPGVAWRRKIAKTHSGYEILYCDKI